MVEASSGETKAVSNTGDVDTIPLDLNPFRGSIKWNENRVMAPTFKRQERELFEMAMMLEGNLLKKSTSFLVGSQKKYFEVIANGAYLAYYER